MYATPTTPLGSVVVTTDGGAPAKTVMVTDWVAAAPLASVAEREAVKAPATVGVPETTPLEELTVTPGGSWPPATPKVMGALPPVAWSNPLTGEPAFAVEGTVAVTVGAA